MNTPLLTAKQVSELTAVSPASLLELARRGSLPHYRFGKSVRFALAEVLAAAQVESTPTTGTPSTRASGLRSLLDAADRGRHHGQAA